MASPLHCIQCSKSESSPDGSRFKLGLGFSCCGATMKRRETREGPVVDIEPSNGAIHNTKHCPNCGDDVQVEHSYTGYDYEEIYVTCKKCGTLGAVNHYGSDPGELIISLEAIRDD